VVIDSIPIHKDSFLKIILVAGARPNFMKVAPIIRVIKTFNQTNQINKTDQRNETDPKDQINGIL
jgi:UDP-N-acetylglucosamine 2-epimerase